MFIQLPSPPPKKKGNKTIYHDFVQILKKCVASGTEFGFINMRISVIWKKKKLCIWLLFRQGRKITFFVFVFLFFLKGGCPPGGVPKFCIFFTHRLLGYVPLKYDLFFTVKIRFFAQKIEQNKKNQVSE